LRQRKTVLVLGAGASKEFGLPLGKGLKQLIASDLNIQFDDFGSRLESGSHEIVEALRLLNRGDDGRNRDINPHRAAAVSISRAMRLSGSIDEFVERHKEDVKIAECAKLAIAKAILAAERESKLYFDEGRRREQLIEEASESWLAYMLRDLTRGKTASELDSAFENLFIINFNYDRCVEQFVFLWFQQIYGLDEDKAAELTKRLSIHHPYGKLGSLPFENRAANIPFGAEVKGHRLFHMLPGIKTYSEAIKIGSQLISARNALGEADRVVFLGFAFHEQNMRLIQVREEHERASVRCYATTMDISAPRLELDKQKIVETLRVSTPQGLFFEGLRGTCENFWDEYGDVVVQ
jgi:hypothetical protein